MWSQTFITIIFGYSCAKLKSRSTSLGCCFHVNLSSCDTIFMWGCHPVRFFPFKFVFLSGCLPTKPSSYFLSYFLPVCCVLFRLSSCQFLILSGCLCFRSTSCHVCCLHVRFSICLVVFLEGNFPARSSFCLDIFLSCSPPVRLSFTQVVFL